MKHFLRFTVLALLVSLIYVGWVALDNVKPKFSNHGPARLLKKDIRKAKSIFFRIQASYELIETGEIIDFDYVLACSSVRIDPEKAKNSMSVSRTGRRELRFPQEMYKATSTGAALHISSFQICKPRASANAHPFTIFHPDVNDIAYGWGYASHHAYERENTDIHFISATVTPANEAAFKKWLKKAKQEFMPTGAIQGPYGSSNFNSRDIAEKWHLDGKIIRWNNTTNYRRCRKFSYLPLSVDLLKKVRNAAPENSGRFWNGYRQRGVSIYEDPKREKLAWSLIRYLKKEKPSFDASGQANGRHSRYSLFEGTPDKNGFGILSDHRTDAGWPTLKPAAYYPFIGAAMGKWPEGVKPVDNVFPISILFDEAYKGLAYCGTPATAPHPMQDALMLKQGEQIWFYINEILVTKSTGRGIPGDHFLDNESGVFLLQ